MSSSPPLRPETRYAASPDGGYVAYQVFGSGPLDIVFITNWVTNMDVMWEEPSVAAYIRSILPTIRVPTLVLHRAGNRHHRVEFGRYLADHIPDAKYVELPGADSFPFHAGDFTPLLDEVRSS